MIYTLINFNKLDLSTLNFNCLGFIHERYRCKNTITLAANEKAKQILHNLELKGKRTTICCSIILLADACICERHPHRPTAIIHAATGWLADLSITLGEETKLAECTRCKEIAASEHKSGHPTSEQDKKVTSCFDKFLPHIQQLEKTIEDLRSDNDMLEGVNNQHVHNIGTLTQVENDQCYVVQQNGHEIHRLLNALTEKDMHIGFLFHSLAFADDENRRIQMSAYNSTMRLVKIENLAHEQSATILTLQSEVALLEDKLEAAGLDAIGRVTLLENALEAYQEKTKQADEATHSWTVSTSQLETEMSRLQVLVQQKESIITNLESRLLVSRKMPASPEEISSWLSIPGLGDSRPITPAQSPCSSRQDSPQRK